MKKIQTLVATVVFSVALLAQEPLATPRYARVAFC